MRKMSEKRIVTAALTGAMSPKAVNPNVPVTPEEIAEEDACRMEHVISQESFDKIRAHVSGGKL